MPRIKEKTSKRRAALFKEEYLAQVKPFPKVRELFERLYADGIKIALASSDVLGTAVEVAAKTDG